jgi:ActR/RegA family two-component response regulator
MSPIIDVLIVDDEKDWNARLKELVEEGFTTDAAYSLGEALERIERQFYYGTLVDLRLIEKPEGDESGLQVLEKLVKLNEGTRGVILTAYPNIESVKVALRDGKAVDYIQKKQLKDPNMRKRAQELIRNMVDVAKADYIKRYGSGITQLTTAVFVTNEHRTIWEYGMISIGKGGHEPLYKFLDLLLHEIPPLLPYKPGEPPFMDTEHATAEGKYWSKGLGESILIKLGRKDRIEAEKQSLASETIIRHVSQGGYGGLILKAGLRFEDLPSKT